MKRIPIKSKRDGETSFRDTEVLGVLPTMRLMEAGETCLFPYDYREAVKSATYLLRKDGYNIASRIIMHEGTKYTSVHRATGDQ